MESSNTMYSAPSQMIHPSSAHGSNQKELVRKAMSSVRTQNQVNSRDKSFSEKRSISMSKDFNHDLSELQQTGTFI
jgi:hypothetical protein